MKAGRWFHNADVARRAFFERLGWLGIALLGLTSMAATVRFLLPRGSRSDSAWFDAGTREDYRERVVSTKWVKRHGVWVVRAGGSLFVLEARCTHLGCTPRWEPEDGKFRCPCHGSRFSLEGTTLNGPAEEPLRRAAIRERRDRIEINPGDITTLDDAEGRDGYRLSV